MRFPQVPPEVDANLHTQLVEMGFPEHRATRGLHFAGGSLDGAVDWLSKHADDADIDEPLLVPKVRTLS